MLFEGGQRNNHLQLDFFHNLYSDKKFEKKC